MKEEEEEAIFHLGTPVLGMVFTCIVSDETGDGNSWSRQASVFPLVVLAVAVGVGGLLVNLLRHFAF